MDQLVGQELKRQMERQNAKEELLNLDTSQVYDKKMNKQLEAALNYAYPYADDTKLYTQMSVSELKKQSQIGREEEDMGTWRESMWKMENGHDGSWNMEHKVRNLKIAVQTTKQKKMAGRVHSGELPIIVYWNVWI